MARLFDGINDSLQSASTINLTAYSKLAISFWLWWDAYANNNDQALEMDTSFVASAGNFVVTPDQAAGQFRIGLNGNVGQSTKSFPRPSSAAWHHYVAHLDMSLSADEVVAGYVDSISQTLSVITANDNTGNFANKTLNFMCRDNSSFFGAGRLCEVAIWGGNFLSTTDIDDLYAGTKLPDSASLSIGAATHYWKICGTASPEPATLGGINLTVNGAVQTDHPSAVAASCGVAPIWSAPLVGAMRW
jgi:hypothetical protein